MATNPPTEITLDETKLYDRQVRFFTTHRQIRLWGMDAQKRLRTARILVIGLNGLSNEVLKNICLAGVASLTIADPGCVSELDLAKSGQFFISRDESIGRNKAEASRDALQKLNPRVEVIAIGEDVMTRDATFFAGFSAVCLASAPLNDAVSLHTFNSRFD
jgi:ubiquitin-like 1-activating enzyme E1 A